LITRFLIAGRGLNLAGVVLAVWLTQPPQEIADDAKNQGGDEKAQPVPDENGSKDGDDTGSDKHQPGYLKYVHLTLPFNRRRSMVYVI